MSQRWEMQASLKSADHEAFLSRLVIGMSAEIPGVAVTGFIIPQQIRFLGVIIVRWLCGTD